MISGERLQDQWSSGFSDFLHFDKCLLLLTVTLLGYLISNLISIAYCLFFHFVETFLHVEQFSVSGSRMCT